MPGRRRDAAERSLSGQEGETISWLPATTGTRTGLAVSEGIRRRLRVNPVLCDGYGYCAEIVPEVISLDDWGFPIVSSRPIEGDDLLRLADRAVATCPRLALLLENVPPDAH